MILSPPTLTKSELVNLYKKEKDPRAKERFLQIISVKCDNQIPYHVIKEIEAIHELQTG
jgi:hypothetical protein